MTQQLWRTVHRFLKKLKIELPCDLAIPLLSTYQKKTKTLMQKYIRTSRFPEALFTKPKLCKQPKYPLLDEWIKKMYDVPTVKY